VLRPRLQSADRPADRLLEVGDHHRAAIARVRRAVDRAAGAREGLAADRTEALSGIRRRRLLITQSLNRRYSARTVSAGSTRAARQAGAAQAMTVAAASVATTAV